MDDEKKYQLGKVVKDTGLEHGKDNGGNLDTCLISFRMLLIPVP